MTSSRPDFSPCTTDTTDTTAPANLVAGALAHLGTHMTTGCPRAAHLAAMLLEKVAADPEANPHLRGHARELAEILDHVQESGTRAPSQPEGSKKRRSAALRTVSDLPKENPDVSYPSFPPTHVTLKNLHADVFGAFWQLADRRCGAG